MRSLPILHQRAALASGRLVNCSGCTVCCERGGLVYLQDEEITPLKDIGVPIITIMNVSFIQRLPDSSCPMLNKAENSCSIYENRPLCCRLFPLDILSIEGRLQWALSTQCPNDRKQFDASQGPNSRIGYGSIARIATSLETFLEKTDADYMKKKEHVSARLGIIEEDQNDWAIVAEFAIQNLNKRVRKNGQEKRD